MPDERPLVVQRRHVRGPVIPASGRRAAQGIQPVRQRGAGHRGEPPVAHRELLGQMIVDRHVGAVVVAHDAARVTVLDPARSQGRSRTGDKPVHGPVGDLPVDRARGVIRIHLHSRCGEMMHRVGATLVVVSQSRAQAVDLRAPVAKGQIPEHVIKGPVLQHHDYDMVDLLQVAGTC